MKNKLIPKRLNGGYTFDPNKTTYHEYWLKNREELLDSAPSSKTGKELKDKYIENLEKTTEYYYPNNEHANVNNYPTSTDSAAIAHIEDPAIQAGAVHNSHKKAITYKNPSETNKVHERTHALNAYEVEAMINGYKNTHDNIHRKADDKTHFSANYLDDTREIYARLMELRSYFDLDPTQKYTIQDLYNMLPQDQYKDFNILNRYTDDFVNFLLNDVAYLPDTTVPRDPNRPMQAAKGCKLISKHLQGARLRHIDLSDTTWGNRGQGNELQSALENGLSWPINKAIDIGNFIGLKLMQLVKSDTESPKPEYYTRKKPNDSKTTQEKSLDLEDWVAKLIRKETRKKELSDAYFIPYIDEKEIKIPGFGRVSENVLDSIYVNAQRAGIPFKDALGLAAYETHLGAIPLFSVDSLKKAFKKKHGYNMPVERVKELENVSLNASVARNFGGIPAQYLINNYDWAKNGWASSPKYKHLKNINSPLEHGFTLYKMGLYNTNAKKHKSEIRDWGNTLLLTKPVKTFLLKKLNK